MRYRLDPQRLSYIHANLPQAVGEEVVAPTVATIYRQIAPNYITKEIFATKREELRTTAANAITARLASDGIVVREVLLRDLKLPDEYAQGLEGLLLKEQQNEQLGTDQEIKLKQVRIAELEAEAQKAREVKQAEAQAQVRVLQAKAESDAMQYTLPLKQKQIEQTKLEAQARKEATLQNADAAAQAKIIDSKAEVERQHNLAEAEANRIRVTAAADSERMKYEAAVLKSNPMLIQKIIAERLSDKLQIMMVPVDGKNFFANDVFRSAFSGRSALRVTPTIHPMTGALCPPRKRKKARRVARNNRTAGDSMNRRLKSSIVLPTRRSANCSQFAGRRSAVAVKADSSDGTLLWRRLSRYPLLLFMLQLGFSFVGTMT